MHFGGIHEDQIVGRAFDRVLMKRFYRYIAPYRWQAIAVLALLPLVAGATLAQPWLVKLAIDRHIVAGRMEGMPLLTFWYLLLIIGESLLSYLEVWLLQFMGQRIMHDIRLELFSHVQRLPASFFDRVPTGNLVTRLTSDVEVLGEMFAAGIVTVVGDIIVLFGIVGIMLWMNLKLSLVTFTVLPLLIWIAFSFRRKMREAYREVRSRLANVNAFLAESIGGMNVVQLFNRQKDEQREFSTLNASYREANLPVITWDASLYAVVETLSSVAVGLLIWYGGGEIIRGVITFGALVAFIQYIEKFFEPIRDLSAKYSIMQGAMAALERIFHLMDTEVSPSPHPSLTRGEGETAPLPRLSMGDITGEGDTTFREIRFNGVWFAYQGDQHVLKGFDLAIRRDEKVALVGETGGGKTTVTRLLSRLYDVTKGSITIDGIDIRELPTGDLRRRIGVVLQDPYLFAGTIEYNISLGDPAAAQRVRLAAEVVGADRFISRLANGYREDVRERGVNFSAGERQLISFARAVAYDPEILVLDEATASMDSETERLIQEGLKGLMAGRTSLVVAHRLSTIQDADRIVVVHRGEKIEEGTHQELLKARGLYYRLYQLQFRD
jgi:ATP-binding cassette, subfamily B, multidrug efflux pump